MKTIINSILLIVLIFLNNLLVAQNYSNLDNSTGTSMLPVLADGNDVIKIIEGNTINKEIVRIEYDLISTTKYSYRTLYKGWTYYIVVFGDYRIDEISLKSYQKSGSSTTYQYYDTGKKDGRTTMLKITPETDTDFKFEITADKFDGSNTVGHFGMIIFH